MTEPETACISPKRALRSELFPLPTGPTMRVNWPFLKTIFWLMCKLGGSSLLQAKELPSLSETAASRGPVWRWVVDTNAGSPSSSSSSSWMFPKPTGPKTLSLLSQRPEGGRAYQISDFNKTNLFLNFFVSIYLCLSVKLLTCNNFRIVLRIFFIFGVTWNFWKL